LDGFGRVEGVGVPADVKGANKEREGNGVLGYDGKSKEWLLEEEHGRFRVLHLYFVLSSIFEFF